MRNFYAKQNNQPRKGTFSLSSICNPLVSLIWRSIGSSCHRRQFIINYVDIKIKKGKKTNKCQEQKRMKSLIQIDLPSSDRNRKTLSSLCRASSLAPPRYECSSPSNKFEALGKRQPGRGVQVVLDLLINARPGPCRLTLLKA